MKRFLPVVISTSLQALSLSALGATALAASAVLAAAPALPAQGGASGKAEAKAPKAKAKAPGAAQKKRAPAAPTMAFVRFSGAYADLAEGAPDLTSLLTGGGVKPRPFYRLVDQLREFGTRKDRKELLLDLTGKFSMNLAQLSEMERCLRGLRKSGKKLYAYMENAGSVQMQLAAQCDRILLADMGAVELPSVALSVTFMKDALDLLGVEMDVVRCGDFKGAVEPYMLSSMSKHLKRHYLAMIEKMNDDVVRRIASGRRIDKNKVRELQARRLITAKEALDVGLVDELVPWIGARRATEKICGKKLRFRDAITKERRKSINFFTLMTNLLNPKSDSGSDVAPGLVVLHLSGGIVDGTNAQPGSIVSGPMVKTIRKVAADKNAKAVVVRVNSPGGSATASEAILLALKDLAKKKPVVFSMGRVAASGGYYVTCVGRPIFAEAGTITGSIGVFGMKPNVGALMRRIGIHEEIVGLDEGATMASIDKGWSSEHKAVMQSFVNSVYDRFTGHVAASRQMPVSDVLKIAGGRVWSGEQAIANGLVDRIGGLDAAVARAARDAGLGEDFEITHVPEPTNPMDALMRQLINVRAALPESTVQAICKRAGGFDAALRILFDALTNDRPTRIWMMMPEGVTVR